jgi:hypothetical protein
MPRLVSEINAGVQFSRSSNEGQLADSTTRVFRIILEKPDETLDVQKECEVFIGDVHPLVTTLFCVSFDARFDSDSRMAVLATFNYQTSPSAQPEDPKSKPPDIRLANWSTSSTLMEVPKSVWAERSSLLGWGPKKPAINPAGDMYDGVTALEPVVTIAIEQWESTDPTRHLLHSGSVNQETIQLGSLSMTPGTVMFRGVNSQPAVESWGDLQYRGWKCVYEFAFRRNNTEVIIGGQTQEFDIGWDIAVPLSGFNCRAFAPGAPADDEDVYGQPLRHMNGKIVPPLLLPDNITAGDRVRAMVRVFEYEDGGSSQAPSSSPIALKPNGRPLKTHDASGNLINDPYVYAYRVQPVINLTNTLGLRLF